MRKAEPDLNEWDIIDLENRQPRKSNFASLRFEKIALLRYKYKGILSIL